MGVKNSLVPASAIASATITPAAVNASDATTRIARDLNFARLWFGPLANQFVFALITEIGLPQFHASRRAVSPRLRI
jgi:hypothetical protein